mmetsp:Transcript_14085/g.33749  ORF Transcript_14085/g.33749 Transcript_14085/m.33749 type:complete len:246 (-) Transcript_14085:523-1260(-)
MVCIILMLFSSAGRPSSTAWGDPTYMGSRLFSSVVRYLTLSLLSFAASVTFMSIAFQLRCALDRPAMATPSTSLHSLDLSCSVMLLNLAMRLRQYSSSVSGPTSSLSLRLASPCSSSASVRSHQSSSTASMCSATSGSAAARLNACGRSSMASTCFLSGFIRSTPPCRLCTASVSVAPNLAMPCTNSVVFSSVFLPQLAWLLRMGTYRLVTRARNESSTLPRTSPAATSCSTVLSLTPLVLTRMK